MNDVTLDNDKCMMSLARIVVKRHKFLSNPMEVDLYTAGNVTRNTGDTKIT